MESLRMKLATAWGKIQQNSKAILDTPVTANVRIVLIFSALMFVAGIAGTYSHYRGVLIRMEAEFKQKLGEKEFRHVLFATDSERPMFSEEIRIAPKFVGNLKASDGSELPVYDMAIYGPDNLLNTGGRNTVVHVKLNFRIALIDKDVSDEMLNWSPPQPTAEPGAQTLLYVVNQALKEATPAQPSYDTRILQASR